MTSDVIRQHTAPSRSNRKISGLGARLGPSPTELVHAVSDDLLPVVLCQSISVRGRAFSSEDLIYQLGSFGSAILGKDH